MSRKKPSGSMKSKPVKAIPVSSTMCYARWPTKDSMVPEDVARGSVEAIRAFAEDKETSYRDLVFQLQASASLRFDFTNLVNKIQEGDLTEGQARRLIRVHAEILDLMIDLRPISVSRTRGFEQ